jgi:hypothetical protein
MSASAAKRTSWTAVIGFTLGVAGLLMALFHFGAGPLDPQPTIGQSIGEIAADIRQSALKGLKGEALPEPQAAPWSLDRSLRTAAIVLGGLALALGALGLVLRENRRLALTAIGLGAATIGFQFFTWVILLIAGVVLIVAILQNMDGILDG